MPGEDAEHFSWGVLAGGCWCWCWCCQCPPEAAGPERVVPALAPLEMAGMQPGLGCAHVWLLIVLRGRGCRQPSCCCWVRCWGCCCCGAGYSEEKRELEDSVLLALANPEVYDEISRATKLGGAGAAGTNRPRGVLLVGPPGTGKTTAARCGSPARGGLLLGWARESCFGRHAAGLLPLPLCPPACLTNPAPGACQPALSVELDGLSSLSPPPPSR